MSLCAREREPPFCEGWERMLPTKKKCLFYTLHALLGKKSHFPKKRRKRNKKPRTEEVLFKTLYFVAILLCVEIAWLLTCASNLKCFCMWECACVLFFFFFFLPVSVRFAVCVLENFHLQLHKKPKVLIEYLYAFNKRLALEVLNWNVENCTCIKPYGAWTKNMHAHSCMHSHAHTRTHTRTHTHTYVCTHENTHTCTLMHQKHNSVSSDWPVALILCTHLHTHTHTHYTLTSHTHHLRGTNCDGYTLI